MEPTQILFLFAAVIVVLGLAANAWGVDSRPGFEDARHPETPEFS
jgi:hypothetical protein